MRCDQCQVAYINGVRCHETGCPLAWRDEIRECSECGCDFEPEDRYQRVCADCLNVEQFYGEPVFEDVLDLDALGDTTPEWQWDRPQGWDHV